jgi:hypothetical protein
MGNVGWEFDAGMIGGGVESETPGIGIRSFETSDSGRVIGDEHSVSEVGSGQQGAKK